MAPFSKFSSPRLATRLLTTCSVCAILVYIVLHLNVLQKWSSTTSAQVQVILLDSQRAPEEPETPTKAPTPESESEFELFLSTRRLVVLATHRINELVQRHERQLQAPVPCSPWWANPLDVQRHIIVTRTPQFVEHLLEFVAVSQYENRTFATVAREAVAPPHDVQFVNDSFTRVEGPFQKFLYGRGGPMVHLRKCLNPMNAGGARLGKGVRAQLEELCSCNLVRAWGEKPDTGLDILDTWPPSSSFLVGDYMNFEDEASMFNILPGNRSQHCGDRIQILVMVSSAPGHTEHRKTIRETYGSRPNLEAHKAELVFLFGRVKDEKLQAALEEEARSHGDLIQANFLDSYHNLTLSHLSMYSYVHFTCTTPAAPGTSLLSRGSYSPPSHIFKADDDFLLNLDTAIAVARANPDAELFGCSYCGTPPVRHRAYMTKYYTPRYMYMGETYPGYLSGVAYVIQGAVLPLFVRAAQSIPIIHMDDAYVTGLVPRALGIYPRNSNFFGYGRVDPPDNGCELRRMGCSYVLNQTDMLVQWRAQQAFALTYAGQGAGGRLGNCTLATAKELKVAKVDKEFKKVCRYA